MRVMRIDKNPSQIDENRVSVMWFGVTMFVEETCWIGTVGTLHVMIIFGISVESFVTGGSFFVATSFISLGCQKNEYSDDSDFGCGEVGDVVTFDGEAISFMFSTLESQKKERSETGFVCGVAGVAVIFVRGAM